MEDLNIGFVAWKGHMEEGFNLMWPPPGYIMRGRKESPRGFKGLMEDLDGYGPAFQGQNLRVGAFRANGWCVLVDTMLDKQTLERAARRLSVNFKSPTIAAVLDKERRRFYIGHWDYGRKQCRIDIDQKKGHAEVECEKLNGHSDVAHWTENDWIEVLKEIELDIPEWNYIDQESGEFEVIEVKREFVPPLESDVPKSNGESKPWWKFWG